jgi:serine/threonine protein kinase
MHAEGTVVGGRYRLERQVGEGGMATVWKAEHMALHSPVAVKFLHTGGRQSKELTERFLREARTAASVRHRNVIEITDFGLTDDGMPFMVLEYLHGQSLAQLMEYNPALDPPEAVRIISLTLRGLAAVHDAGIVHRDLKPENLFLVTDADGTFPKLLDFGVSRRVGLASDITQEGALIGTPDYMSPEQACGERDVDRRTDIYSMGVILYETLTGRLPFEAERIGDLIQKITHESPPTVHELRPDLPPPLSDVVARAMARDRDDRFPDARQMRWALIEAADTYGFRHTGSALISISELPPPTDVDEAGGGVARVPTGDVTIPRTAPLPREATGPTDPIASDPGTPQTTGRGQSRPALALLVLLALGAAGVALYGAGGMRAATDWLNDRGFAGDSGARAADTAVPTGPQPWAPVRTGLPPELLDAGVGDAGASVHLALLDVPEAAVVRVDGVMVAPATALPAGDHPYVVEVFSQDGDLLWWIRHPGTRDGTYIVWPMDDAELAADTDEPPPAEPMQQPRRQGRVKR